MKKTIAALLSAAALIAPTLARADVSFLTGYVAATSLGAKTQIYPLVGQSACAVDVENTFVGTIQVQGIVNTVATPLLVTPINQTGPSTLNITAPGIYTASCSGMRAVQAVVTAYTSGEADISLNAAPGSPQLNGQTITVSNQPSTYPITTSTTLPVAVQNFPAYPTPIPYPSNQPVTVTNTPGVTVQNTPAVSVVNFPTPVPNQAVTITPVGATYKVLTTAGTTTLKSGAGIYYGASSLGGTVDQITTTTCYDNASAASGNILSENALLHNTVFSLPFGVYQRSYMQRPTAAFRWRHSGVL